MTIVKYFFYFVFSGIFLCVLFPVPAYATINWDGCRTEVIKTTIPSGQSSEDYTLTQSITDVNKAFILVNSTGKSTVDGGEDHLVSGYIFDKDTIRLERGSSVGAAVHVSFSLVECFQNEFYVQRGEIKIGPSKFSATDTITSVTEANAMVIVSSRVESGVKDQYSGLVLGELIDPTMVKVSREVSSSTSTFVRYEVVEFSTESNVTLQKGTLKHVNGNREAATIRAVDPNHTWVYCSFSANDNSVKGGSIGCELENPTTVTAWRYATGNTRMTNMVRYTAIEFPADTVFVEHASTKGYSTATADDIKHEQDITIAEVASLTKAFPFVTSTTQGAGTSFPRNRWVYTLFDTTTLRATFWRGASGGRVANSDKYWQIVSFKVDPPDQPTVTTVISGTELNITSSTYSGGALHKSTDWKVVTSNNCLTGTSVWENINDTVNLLSVSVDDIDGTFMNDLSGKTALVEDQIYYACVRHQNSGGHASWSSAFSFVTNEPPEVLKVDIDSGASSITITPGGNKLVTGTTTIRDTDSCQDIDAVTGIFYRTSQGPTGGANKNYRYPVSCTLDSGTCTSENDNKADYTCSFNVAYYADPTDSSSPNRRDSWSLLIKPSDGQGVGITDYDTVELSTVAALEVTSAFNFGNLTPGEDTGSTNQTVTVTNIGNIRLDASMQVYGSTIGDGKAMTCTTGDIDSTNLKYGLTPFTYNERQSSVPSVSQEIDLDLAKSTGNVSTKDIFLGLKITDEFVEGSCSATLNIDAVADTIAD